MPPRRSWTVVGPARVISSRPSLPWKTRARSQPSPPRIAAMRGARSGLATPSACRFTRAGLESGPRMLKTVRMPISPRVGPACRMAGWKAGANRKATPTRSRHRSACSAVTAIFTPRASSTSALPHRLDALRLPCLATVTPAAAATMADARRNVKAVRGVAARAAGVDGVRRRGDGHGGGAHGAGEAEDLVVALALHAQRGEQRREPRRRDLARHDRRHHALRLGGVERAALHDLVQRLGDHVSRSRRALPGSRSW